MPELPEVETIRRELERDILNQRIGRVEVLAAKTIHGKTGDFIKQLTGNSIAGIDRWGKLLIFDLKKGGHKLLIHLKMTGQLVYKDTKKLVFGGHNISESDLVVPNRFTRVVLHFSNHKALYFNDMRRFGFMKLVEEADLGGVVAKSYGVDALSPDFTEKYLQKALKKRAKTTIKAALLDQKHLAGIGNIYADEVCFATGILPNRRVNTLSVSKIKEIYKAIKRVLNLAIKHGGTTFTSARRSQAKPAYALAGFGEAKEAQSQFLAGHFVRSDGAKGNFTQYLKVFDRTGQKCLRCKKGIIQKNRVARRGTHFCQKCQK
ncbi:MAG: hypothetical protein A3I32_03160 [Candidatus Yanofskybacteria bacterium RIFCSPLOWO2_02_FULL_45_10]|uniref:Uncharacterized protein n=2 Tax=Candidatus Yanofskyibacteriota TaxID=1752733 RepID=A0A1F8G5Q6_9BACT|nr:MAG: hypothetical protein A3F25_02490 [Candidatus Yanofskybacteria bacterium RIFCSPHIGHO2_12_FULL_45_19b]OGN32058.1 MAG: hypothetical protein A3I32_03160 [Candidatus Yanofskybacteria bacterium RIFCSPLOWO2_02_FULL_45_10]